MSYPHRLRPDAQPLHVVADQPVPSGKRCAPNLPGSLTRSLSRRLGVDATTAMRIALLYGDMEWMAAGSSQVRYSARDYARRQGLSRNTVLADLQRLQRLGALSLQMECSVALALYGLHGLYPDHQDMALAAGEDGDAFSASAAGEVAQPLRHPGSRPEPPGSILEPPPGSPHQPPGSPAEPPGSNHEPPGSAVEPPSAFRAVDPGSPLEPPPGSRHEPPLAQAVSHPWLTTSATLEKGLKEEQKEEEKAEEGQQPQRLPSHGQRMGSSPQPEQEATWSHGATAALPAAHLRERDHLRALAAISPEAQEPSQNPGQWHHFSRARPVTPSRPCLSRHPLSEPDGAAVQPSAGPVASRVPEAANALLALLDRLLDAYRAAKPAEWPIPSELTLSPVRKGKLQAALRYAGSAEALEQRLRAALAHVPPWYRATYPVRPDGSPRPAHQFFDVLFRATGDEREAGLEAWHLFAWSEAGTRGAASGGNGAGQAVAAGAPAEAAPETDLERARRLFVWDPPNWRLRAIEAYALSLAERRHLTGLLEAEGEAYPGAGAFEFADPPPEPMPAKPAVSPKEAA